MIFPTKALSKIKKHAKILYEKYFTVFTVWRNYVKFPH